MIKLCLALMLTCFAIPAFAENAEPDPNYKMLDLYPKGRAAYQEKSDQNAERYQAQGYDFIERLYEDRAEGGSTSTATPPMPEAEVDSYIESTQGNTVAPSATPAQ